MSNCQNIHQLHFTIIINTRSGSSIKNFHQVLRNKTAPRSAPRSSCLLTAVTRLLDGVLRVLKAESRATHSSDLQKGRVQTDQRSPSACPWHTRWGQTRLAMPQKLVARVKVCTKFSLEGRNRQKDGSAGNVSASQRCKLGGMSSFPGARIEVEVRGKNRLYKVDLWPPPLPLPHT